MRRPAAPRVIPPPLELECLKILWTLGEARVKDVRDALAPRRDLAYTTVMTVLDRLARKHGVSRRKSGRSFIYTPALDRGKLRNLAVQELIETHFDGSREELLAWLGAPSEGEAAVEAVAGDEQLDTALL